jgi:glucosamine-phosphate N-acetyltransferase
MYIIRELLESDYYNYIELINDFRETLFTKDEFISKLKYINNYSYIYVIEQDFKLIATATLIIEQKFIYNCSKLAHIEDVCVKKEYRKQGFGKILINKVIEEAKLKGCYKVTLDCSESNSLFYISTGFEVRGLQLSQLLK